MFTSFEYYTRQEGDMGISGVAVLMLFLNYALMRGTKSHLAVLRRSQTHAAVFGEIKLFVVLRFLV